MIHFFRKHRESIVVMLIGCVIFTALNVLMLQTNFDLWTNPKVGFWSAFHKGFQFSGFDGPTYIVISSWRPLYTLFRHPLLAAMMWPLAELNEWLKDVTGMNCAIFIVATLWTLLSTCSWMLLYKLLRRVVRLSYGISLLLCLFYFSFAYVMLATFIPDHMIISMTTFLLALWLANRPSQKGRAMKTWQALLLALLSMGVASTNVVKIWIVDMMSRVGRTTWLKAVRHSLLYLLPLAIVAGAYYYQENTTQKEEEASARKMDNRRKAKSAEFIRDARRKAAIKEQQREKQVFDSKLFEWTDNSIDRLRTLKENVFGEGLILHEQHLMEDANKTRPVFVEYNHWGSYAVELLIVALFAAGLWCGRHERLMLTVTLLWLFDMLLHVVLSFAITDLYIMTAHWAYVIPIAVGYLLRSMKKRWQYSAIALVSLLTLYMYLHNVSLIAGYILSR